MSSFRLHALPLVVFIVLFLTIPGAFAQTGPETFVLPDPAPADAPAVAQPSTPASTSPSAPSTGAGEPLTATPSPSAEAAPLRVAILAFEFLGGADAQGDKTAHHGRMVTEIFTTEAVRGGVFRVVERKQLETVLAEMEFGESGLSGSAAQKIGAMVNADAVLSGAVSEYHGELRIDARLIRVKDGQVVLADKAFATKSLPSLSAAVEEVLGRMAQALAPKTTPDMASLRQATPESPATPATPALGGVRPLSFQEMFVTASSTLPPLRLASFDPANVQDRDPSTAWLAQGDPAGAWLELRFEKPTFVTEIQCINGNAKPLAFRQYGRVKEAQVILDDGRRLDVTLADSFLWQPLARVDGEIASARIVIKSAYPGRRWKDAGFSEVEVLARDQ